jgi:hypothetical protein
MKLTKGTIYSTEKNVWKQEYDSNCKQGNILKNTFIMNKSRKLFRSTSLTPTVANIKLATSDQVEDFVALCLEAERTGQEKFEGKQFDDVIYKSSFFKRHNFDNLEGKI